MARREECIPRWLWHAFDALDTEKHGAVAQIELKVLTAHIGNSLGASNSNSIANELVKKFDSVSRVDFDSYLKFLQDIQFLVMENMDLAKLEEVSWMICGSRYESRPKAVLGQDEVYKMWRIFNFFAEPGKFPVILDNEEAVIMFEKLVVAMGSKWSSEDFLSSMASTIPDTKFTSCLRLFERLYARSVDKMCAVEGIAEVYNTVIEEVEKMGYIKKKGHKVTSWKDRWFILKPGSMAYFVDKTLKEQKGDIQLSTSWKVEVLADQKGYKNMFLLHSLETSSSTAKTRYEMSAPDPRTRQEWITAIENVLKRMESGESPHVRALERRRSERRDRLEEAEEVARLRRLQVEECERQRQRYEEMEKLRDEAAKRAEEELARRIAKEKEEEENRRREMEERAKTQLEIDALKAARDAAARAAEEELARRLAQEKEEEENRRKELEEKAKTQEEMDRLKAARDEATRKAEEELARRIAKEKEEEENRRRDLEEKEKTQQEIDALRAAREDAERRALEEAEKLAARTREEEERRRLEEEEKERQAKELEELKRAYQDVTKRAEIEERLKVEEQKRLAELEESLNSLKLALEEEKQAKKDEEIVRALQSKILCEEIEKREELERLKEEQEAMLKQEQEKREHLELWSEELVQQRLDQAQQLEQERERLRELEEERKAADIKLRAAAEKLSLAEEAKRKQESRRRELEKPVGLARLIQPRANPLITHRGLGAFTMSAFELERERRQREKTNVPDSADVHGEAGPVNGVNGVTENHVEGER
ncbi:uncharacterized protein [Diadema setosum]|uniref:uncharacterized protein n=1 Tax=Diadema setosum TaxID=31175 RepID=UPI003B3AD501